VLLVEDDPLIAQTLAMSLRYQGFDLTHAGSLADAESQLERRDFDLLLLDVGLPDGSGIELCRRIRARDAEVPILMLTARTDEATAVAGIEGGADDHVRKPYGLHELVARMRRLLARHAGRAPALLQAGALTMDCKRHGVAVGGVPLHLAKREFAILQLLLQAQGEVVTRDRLLDALQCEREIYDRTIDSHLSHLRRKLKDAGAGLRIAAVYGVGYRLEAGA
jgi:DNA-binding response OmpR family regulator